MNKEYSWLLSEKYNGVETPAFFADVTRLKNGEPLAFILDTTPFIDLTIHLDSKPLIPRTETEFWVHDVLQGLTKAPSTILDLCAGSGCIGLAALQTFPDAQVDFAEIDTTHEATILKNIRENNLPESHARIFGGDLFEKVPGVYDIIFANPPYIDPVLDRTEESVVSYEPHQALYGGVHGMEIITRIIQDSPRYLTQHGILYIEHEPEQCEEIQKLGAQAGFATAHHKDQYDVYRYSKLCKNM